jgi:hypothetical protein
VRALPVLFFARLHVCIVSVHLTLLQVLGVSVCGYIVEKRPFGLTLFAECECECTSVSVRVCLGVQKPCRHTFSFPLVPLVTSFHFSLVPPFLCSRNAFHVHRVSLDIVASETPMAFAISLCARMELSDLISARRRWHTHLPSTMRRI